MDLNLSLPSRPNIEQLRKQSKTLLKMHRRNDTGCCSVLRRLHQFADASEHDILAADVALNDVQFALAMFYGFDSWEAFKEHAETQSVPVTMQLEKLDGQACIRGLETLDWGGSFFQRQESFMTALTPILRAAGHGVDFEVVMGLSGAAFKLSINQPWCPSTGSSGVGADCPDHIMKVFGCGPMENLEPPSKCEATGAAIIESIDRGLPVMYMDGESSLIVGYRDAPQTWICQPYPGGKGYREMDSLKGMLGEAWWVNIIRPGQPTPRRTPAMESLRRIAELARAPQDDDCVNGFAAYEAWIADLANPPGDPNLHANAYSYAILLTSRTAGAVYLGRLARELGGDAVAPLESAAMRYRTVSQRLLGGKDCVEEPWKRSWTPENRAIQADIMTQNLADERIAVAEIEKALAMMA